MKKIVSKSGAVFGQAVVDEDGGRDVPNIANLIIGVGARGKMRILWGLCYLHVEFWSGSKTIFCKYIDENASLVHVGNHL